ncbi:MAG: hydrogenase maturation protease [SAR324 cluster bacterium]|nr:hydrogenase maturation protease [SAR324 cluster bacterium]
MGNMLNSDDAFGPLVVQGYQQSHTPQTGLKLMETGIGGINIIQEMLLSYQGLILVDAFEEKFPPGTLRVLEPVVEDLALNVQQQRDYFADTHYATPARVLQFLKNIGKLPPYLRILACEPSSLEPCTLELSKVVSRAIPEAVQLLQQMIEDHFHQQKSGAT